MAGSQIVCSIYTINLGDALSDLVAKWLARRTLVPADQGRLLCGHLLYNIFFSSSYSIS